MITLQIYLFHALQKNIINMNFIKKLAFHAKIYISLEKKYFHYLISFFKPDAFFFITFNVY